MNLEDRNKYIEGLERELSSVLDLLNEKNKRVTTTEFSVGTQTEELSPSTTISPTNTQTVTEDSYHTAFEASPEAFGLLPASASSLSLQHPLTSIKTNLNMKKKSINSKLNILGSWQKIKANDDHISSVVQALQKVKIDSDISRRDGGGGSGDTNIVDKWLNQNVNDHQQGNLSYPIS